MGLFSFLNKGKQDADDDIDVPVRPRRRVKAQEDEPLDPMLPEKKRARRRLIGATALVLAAVIGLPMIFDSEPKPLTDDIAIQIPSRDKSGTTIAVPQAQPTQVPDLGLQNKSNVSVAQAPVTEKLPAAEPLKPAAEKPAEKLTDKPASDKSSSAATEKEKLAAEKTKSSHYIIQVAAVANKVKADELQSRLKQSGIKSYSQKISTKDGDRYRIRVGPFGSRDDADKMRARLSKMGLSSAVQPD